MYKWPEKMIRTSAVNSAVGMAHTRRPEKEIQALALSPGSRP
jgi:hypothetical protein